MSTRYVLGFLFNKSRTQVALILKNRPVKQAGRYNGVGGKINRGELSVVAMRREFKEETGLNIQDWDLYARYRFKFTGSTMFVFRAFLPDDNLPQLTMLTDELPGWMNVDDETNAYVDDAEYLIRTALSHPIKKGHCIIDKRID